MIFRNPDVTFNGYEYRLSMYNGRVCLMARGDEPTEEWVDVALMDNPQELGRVMANLLSLDFDEPDWIALTRRTNDPKLSALERMLDDADISNRRNGESFHAPILEVPGKSFDAAWRILDPIDDIADDDPRWGASDLDAYIYEVDIPDQD